MTSKITTRSLGVISFFLFSPAVLVASPADNTWLEVHVVDRSSGRPLPEAAVCLGTQGVADQFGAVRTDSNGVVRFRDLSRTTLQVTASRQGYQGEKRLLEPLYQSRILELSLTTGGGGPACDAPVTSSPGRSQPSLAILAVDISPDSDAGASRVLVSINTRGKANQVRISENADFAGARWVELTDPLAVELSAGSGLKTLYTQVRRFSGSEGASVDMRSPVKRVSYRVP